MNIWCVQRLPFLFQPPPLAKQTEVEQGTGLHHRIRGELVRCSFQETTQDETKRAQGIAASGLATCILKASTIDAAPTENLKGQD